MKRLLIFCTLIIPCFIAQAVIVTADFIKNSMPELAAKKFIFFGDVHISMREDLDQLKSLTRILHKRAAASSEQLHLLIEQTPGVPADDSVISNLSRNLPHHKNTVVQNIEMRCHTGAAWYVLNPDRDPSTFCAESFYSTGYGVCRLGDNTIGDLDHEVDYFKLQIENWAASTPLLYARAIHSFEAEFQAQLKYYKLICSTLSLTPEINILTLSKTLHAINQFGRQSLYKAIKDLASVLFDMHICKTIMTLREPDMIVLVAGSWHTSQASGFLAQCGNRISHYGTDWGPIIKPLPQEYLDLNTGFQFAYCSCTVQ